MAEQSRKLNKISDYEGLEVLCKLYLKQLKYKSDLIILIVYHILKERGYDCVEQKYDSDNICEPVTYEILNSLPVEWNELPNRYKLFYKKDDDVKIVTGTNENDRFLLNLLKDDHSRGGFSCSFSLKLYIPDEFFDKNHSRYKDLESIINVSDVMNMMTASMTTSGYEQFNKFGSAGDIIRLRGVPPFLNDGRESSVLSTVGRCPPRERIQGLGNYHLQDPKRHHPGHPINNVFVDGPDIYNQEDLEGPPTDSLYT